MTGRGRADQKSKTAGQDTKKGRGGSPTAGRATIHGVQRRGSTTGGEDNRHGGKRGDQHTTFCPPTHYFLSPNTLIFVPKHADFCPVRLLDPLTIRTTSTARRSHNGARLQGIGVECFGNDTRNKSKAQELPPTAAEGAAIPGRSVS